MEVKINTALGLKILVSSNKFKVARAFTLKSNIGSLADQS